MATINCKGKLIDLQKPVIMGILNATPDSFYTGNLNNGIEQMVLLAEKMLSDGATFIDIGGQSTNPKSKLISKQEEAQRVLPVIEAILKKQPNALLSVDTFYADVAEQAIGLGACMVNDISAGELDEGMMETVAKLQVPYIAMHMQGTPQTMQLNPQYKQVVGEVFNFFISKLNQLKAAGIFDIIIDPGFGFGKTIAQNFSLLKQLAVFKTLEVPVLVGLSRKSMIYKTLHCTAAEALNGTTVLHSLALQNGANILRVHDVKEAKEAIELMEAYKNAD